MTAQRPILVVFLLIASAVTFICGTQSVHDQRFLINKNSTSSFLSLPRHRWSYFRQSSCFLPCVCPSAGDRYPALRPAIISDSDTGRALASDSLYGSTGNIDIDISACPACASDAGTSPSRRQLPRYLLRSKWRNYYLLPVRLRRFPPLHIHLSQ